MGFVSVNNSQIINKAFGPNQPLQQRIYQALAASPDLRPLFEDIAKYTSDLQDATSNAAAPPQPSRSQAQPVLGEGPAPKKRKIANGGDSIRSSSALAGMTQDADLQIYVQDMSFAVPQRKKLQLEITRAPGNVEYLRARNQALNMIEFGVPFPKIQHVLCLPVPEKSQKQFNFCIIPEGNDGISAAKPGEPVYETIVWTVPDGPPRTAFLGSGTPAMEGASLAETYQGYLQSILDEKLKHTRVICPDEKEFVSAIPEPHRKGEKAFHVKAFRGSKEGYMFLLSTGIFFGFKKPLIFFAFDNIESISYTSVLQRTFNLNILTRSSTNPDHMQEFELSMIDQADYPGIDAYVKKHRLQDASLVEARRAKSLNINGEKGENQEAHAEGTESELLKAQRELEDQEDEEEEDYDPGSDGDSDGSGTSSEEEDDHYGDEDHGEGRNLVKEELGSEAEDVEV
ncbi:histone chaperone [Coccidioides immitis RS]|uniref:Histone chaperone RTT106 n=2 Tax=Coccidioides immitis TaxID=5501 RepID=RT106_COCIM|nr:histone chaperone [Coccidioides immitis RS]Q1E076.1 RecName: Full=Histone chaperone RTT106 [Coccidioides immitis RS]EAS33013.3 histone chaperone [Coccidioides immitis RS]KMP08292.1 meiotically up-regulated gene 183 protein [Coccidioides immitis RMSCC 2394]